MSDIPGFPYALLWEERQLVPVANLTRQDGIDCLHLVSHIPNRCPHQELSVRQANHALADLRASRFDGGGGRHPMTGVARA